MFSIYLYVIIGLIILLIVFIVRQIRLRQAIARRRTLRHHQSPGETDE